MDDRQPPAEFERTSCACAACVACCKRQPGPLAPGDLERIAAHLGQTPDDAAALFWRSPGALVEDLRTGARRMIGTITPRLEGGRCVFLTADDRCYVHAAAPFGCAFFDTHMTPAAYGPRALWLYTAVERDVTYQAVRASLPEATSWRPVLTAAKDGG